MIIVTIKKQFLSYISFLSIVKSDWSQVISFDFNQLKNFMISFDFNQLKNFKLSPFFENRTL